MKYLLSISMAFFVYPAFANVQPPQKCHIFPIKGETIVLPEKKSGLVLIHNLSKEDLWITHPVSDPSASAGWSSRLQGEKWSALVVSEPSFELSCIESKPGHEQQIPCNQAVLVCLWKAVTIPEKMKGTFWAGENMSLSQLTTDLGKNGYGLPDPGE